MNENLFDLELYNFKLPKELIAQHPPAKRSDSKLLVYNRFKDEYKHLKFSQIVDILDENYCIVFNNTKVEMRKIICLKPTGGKIPVLITSYEDNFIKCLPYKGLKKLQILILPNNRVVKVVNRDETTSEWILEGSINKKEISEIIQKYGLAPLPPYIKRIDKEEENKIDKERYQTIFAKVSGSIAAPTAGFHFDENLIQKLQQKGIKILYITLNIGLSTFKPIKTQDIRNHKLFPEKAVVDSVTAEAINRAKKEGRKILCVGTTTVRTLEFLVSKFGEIIPYEGEVDTYIYPGYKFSITDALITNFHLPKSTNLLLVAALIGREKLFELYKIAIENKYNFYSYGDAMLII